MSEKKMVSRNVAIALTMICIALIAGLGGAMAYYVSTHSHVNSDYDSLSTQLNNLTSIVDFANSIVWVNNETVDVSAGRITNMTFEANFPGFIIVSVQSGNASFFNVEVQYQYFNATLGISELDPLNFDESHFITLGYLMMDNTSFPILPSSVEIIVSNPALFGPVVFETVITITYYY